MARTSEVVSKRTMKGVKKTMSKPQNIKNTENTEGKEPQNTKSTGGATKKGMDLSTFQDILNDFMDGLSIQQLAEKHNLMPDTVKAKLPKLQLEAKRAEDRAIAKLEREGKLLPAKPGDGGVQTVQTTVDPGVAGVQTVQSTGNTPNPGVQTPPVPPPAVQNPPSTYTVPAVPAGVVLPTIQPTPQTPPPILPTLQPAPSTLQPQLPVLQPTPQTSLAVKNSGAEEGEEGREPAPRWLRHDGGELVNTIEMAIRGVQSKDTFSPITIVLLSYLKYLCRTPSRWRTRLRLCSSWGRLAGNRASTPR